MQHNHPLAAQLCGRPDITDGQKLTGAKAFHLFAVSISLQLMAQLIHVVGPFPRFANAPPESASCWPFKPINSQESDLLHSKPTRHCTLSPPRRPSFLHQLVHPEAEEQHAQSDDAGDHGARLFRLLLGRPLIPRFGPLRQLDRAALDEEGQDEDEEHDNGE
jgi:hypothetical protein